MSKEIDMLFDGTGYSMATKGNIAVLREALGYNLMGQRNAEANSAEVGVEQESSEEDLSVDKYSTDGNEKIVYYQHGLGAIIQTTETVKKGQAATWDSTARIALKSVTSLCGVGEDDEEQILATGIVDNIRRAYTFLVKNYKDGDKVNLFGFSRGGYTARLLMAIVEHIGLIDPAKLNNDEAAINAAIDRVFALFAAELNPADNPEASAFKAANCHPSENFFNHAALLESVPGIILEEVHRDARLGPVAKSVRCYAAADERRRVFLLEGIIPTDDSMDFEHTWYRGSHVNVGAGPQADRGVANVVLHDVVADAIAHGVNIDPASIAQYVPNAEGMLYESFEEDIVTGVGFEWDDVTSKCRRPLLQTTEKERLSKQLLFCFGKESKEEFGPVTKYAPSNVAAALMTLKSSQVNDDPASQADRMDLEEETYAEVLAGALKRVAPRDEWSDNEDELECPILVPGRKRRKVALRGT